MEFNYSMTSNISSVPFLKNTKRAKCIPLQKFCDNFPDCENKEDEPQGCNKCTSSEIRCRYRNSILKLVLNPNFMNMIFQFNFAISYTYKNISTFFIWHYFYLCWNLYRIPQNVKTYKNIPHIRHVNEILSHQASNFQRDQRIQHFPTFTALQ